MPFTLSHAVVALPFVRARRLSAAAIAAGAMVPDLPLFAPVGVSYEVTHQLWAAPTVDLVLGCLALLVWAVVIRPALVAVAPAGVRRRVPPDTDRASVPRLSLLVLISIALGSVTHVVWDTFTHEGRLGTRLLPVLNHHLGSLAVASVLQYASSVVGLVLLLVAAGVALHRTPPAPTAPSRLGRAQAPLLGLALLALVVPAGLEALAVRGSIATRALAVATGSIDGVAVVLFVVGIVLGFRPAAPRRP